jgi:probable selenium-dependent hydroxylase accessory protein YqeC
MNAIMELRAAIEEARLRRKAGGGVVAAFVGAGGKTTAIFALARLAADEGLSVAVTTTTRIYDPRDEVGRPFDGVVVEPLLGQAEASGTGLPEAAAPRPGGILVLASGRDEKEGKLIGIDPSRCPDLAAAFDLVLVEADGSRGLPVKAPAGHEPVLPAGAGLVFGFIGLDCLGKPASTEVIHRLDRFLSVTGADPGSTIAPAHLGRLAGHPEGLFKSAPAGALRVVVLNKADSVSPELAERAREAVAASGAASRVILASLGRQAVPH